MATTDGSGEACLGRVVVKLQFSDGGPLRRVLASKILSEQGTPSFRRLETLAIQYAFPDKTEDSFRRDIFDVLFTYTDEDGDVVGFGSDDELEDAIRQFVDKVPPVLRVQVNATRKENREIGTEQGKEIMEVGMGSDCPSPGVAQSAADGPSSTASAGSGKTALVVGGAVSSTRSVRTHRIEALEEAELGAKRARVATAHENTVARMQEHPAPVAPQNGTSMWHVAPPNIAEASVSCVSELEDNILQHVFQFLLPVCLPKNEEEDGVPEESRDPQLSLTFVRDPVTIRDEHILALVSSYQAIVMVCKTFRQVCRKAKILPLALGPIDVSFHDGGIGATSWVHVRGTKIEVLFYAELIARNRLRLRSLKMKALSFHDMAVMAYVLHRCDTEDLRIVNANFANENIRFSFLYRSWHNLRSPGLLTTTETVLDMSELAFSVGMPALYTGDIPCSLKELHTLIAAQCPNLESLKVNLDDASAEFSEKAREGISEELFGCSSLRRLHLVLRTPPSLSAIISHTIQKSPSLEALVISRPSRAFRPKDPTIQIESSSLISLIIDQAGKGIYLTRCCTPKLKRLICNGSGLYGNGVRLRSVNGTVDLNENRTGQIRVRDARFDGVGTWCGETVTFEPLVVHESCIVDFRGCYHGYCTDDY